MNEDPRKTGLKNGLRQLTVEQLFKVLDYPDEMVLDQFNYQDGKFCPLAIALELDKKIKEPTNNIVVNFLTKLGFKVYNTRGIKGKFYTTHRKEDLITATNEVLKEKLQHNIVESAKLIARYHNIDDPSTTEIYLSPHETEIRLVEISLDIRSTYEVFPVKFEKLEDRHVYFESVIILLSSEEWEMLKEDKLEFPWEKETLQRIL